MSWNVLECVGMSWNELECVGMCWNELECGLFLQLECVVLPDKPDPPPGQPAVTSITRTSVVLSWYGSGYDGGSPVINYKIESSCSGGDWELVTDQCIVSRSMHYQVNQCIIQSINALLSQSMHY